MTLSEYIEKKEKAIARLKAKRECIELDTKGNAELCDRNCGECKLNYEQGNMGEQKIALDMAIKALEQEPCEDAVSRKEVLEMIEQIQDVGGFIGYSTYSEAFDVVDNMPPVTPTHCVAAVRFSKDDLREICNERIEIECTHGMCKDCAKSKVLNDFEGYSIVCSRFGRMAVNPDFYCADFEKRGDSDGSN